MPVSSRIGHITTQTYPIAIQCSLFLPPGPKLYKEPSAKSNKHIIQNALAHCCLAGKVNEGQKNKILDVCFVFLYLYFNLLYHLSSAYSFFASG